MAIFCNDLWVSTVPSFVTWAMFCINAFLPQVLVQVFNPRFGANFNPSFDPFLVISFDIFVKNRKFWSKIKKFGQKSKFLSKIENFAQRSKFLVKNRKFCSTIGIFVKNRKFWSKIEILVNNRKFWSKIKTKLIKNRNFCQK